MFSYWQVVKFDLGAKAYHIWQWNLRITTVCWVCGLQHLLLAALVLFWSCGPFLVASQLCWYLVEWPGMDISTKSCLFTLYHSPATFYSGFPFYYVFLCDADIAIIMQDEQVSNILHCLKSFICLWQSSLCSWGSCFGMFTHWSLPSHSSFIWSVVRRLLSIIYLMHCSLFVIFVCHHFSPVRQYYFHHLVLRYETLFESWSTWPYSICDHFLAFCVSIICLRWFCQSYYFVYF